MTSTVLTASRWRAAWRSLGGISIFVATARAESLAAHGSATKSELADALHGRVRSHHRFLIETLRKLRRCIL